MHSIARLVVISFLTFISVAAQAWWDEAWTQRTKVTLNTSGTGAETRASLSGQTIAVRLHSGNFDFLSAKEDGSDLRVLAGDDKTPLKFHIERFDGVNELAVLWVQVPTLAAGSDQNVLHVYAGNGNAAAEQDAAGSYGGNTLAVFHFGESEGVAVDATKVSLKSSAPVEREANGLLGGAARLNGTAITVPAGEALRLSAAAGYTLSAWLRPGSVAAGTVVQLGNVGIQMADGKLGANVGGTRLAGGSLVADTWQHVALVVGGGKAVLYVNGAEAAQADAAADVSGGDLQIGSGFAGLIDEVKVSSVALGADALKVAHGAEGADGKLLSFVKEAEGEESGGGEHNYFGVLVDNLTVDAWVVIIILAVMFVIACWVMVAKSLYIARTERANLAFLRRFRDAGDAELLKIGEQPEIRASSLAVLYRAGVREIEKRFAARASLSAAASHALSGASIDAIKASIDADLVRENHKLNSLIVLLTIAISGGPFLGLLGTVVGVMITFAAIAAAGDVNVNAIAPGIAAALLATVAGLAVAIPALFGYNWLAAKIKNISSDMQIFVDEFVTRVAEKYGD